jgi:hypothetical protein
MAEEIKLKGRVKRIVIEIIPMRNADEEYTWKVPKYYSQFVMHARGANDVRISDKQNVVAASDEPYFTMKAGSSLSAEDLGIDFSDDIKLYLASPDADVQIEVMGGML